MAGTCESALLVTFAFAYVIVVVSALYFPMPDVSLTLPDAENIAKGMPPLLKLRAIGKGNSYVTYALLETTNKNLFGVVVDDLILERRASKEEYGRHTLKVLAEVDSNEKAEAAVNITLTKRKLICDDFTWEMCFWTEGKLRIPKSQEPTQIGFFSSDFLLTLCNNYSVTYQMLTGTDHFGVERMANVNTDSWVLSLKKSLADVDVPSASFEVACSVSADSGSPRMHRQRFVFDIPENSPWEEPSVTQDSLQIMSLIVSDDKEENISPKYPESVEISQFAAFASRVAEPVDGREKDDSRRAEQLRRIAESGITFTIESGQIFGITQVGGIVHLLNPTAVRKATAPFRITVSWTDPKGFASSSVLFVNVTQTADAVCQGKQSEGKIRRPCSQKKSVSDCLKTCGISTGLLIRNSSGVSSSGCQWRHNDYPENLSLRYRTCSPDLNTCPDRFCDPLEVLFPDICPQDCSENIYGSANMDYPQPGISSASGVCSCNRDGCTCGLLDLRERQGKGRKAHGPEKSTEPPVTQRNEINVNELQASILDRCGIVCLSSIFAGSVTMLFALLMCLLILYHRRLKKRSLNQGPLKEDMININYEEYIDRTAEGLRVSPNAACEIPDYYDKKWEFPRHKLTVEETIGEGEFGKVLKAVAEGIGNGDEPTVVAVKTLKENARESELADLVSEFQLLKEVDHPNIIHLLGACTTLDGPLYIIIEYAKHGSLRNYLRRNRNLGSELQLSDKESKTNCMLNITSNDILTFAWQIAKGMAYLTDVKLVHRDLAARNVLVAEGLICKISDFGLTRDIYEDDTYLKRSKGRVPVKWMAPESLSDHLYTTKSDVWSYGIVLWELVTTGASPYPGIAVQNLFHLLKSGYRMEKPPNCSSELYQILRACWNENPAQRPTFKYLVSKLEEMLSEGKDYLDLNPMNIDNKTYFTDFSEEEEGIAEERKGLKWMFDDRNGLCSEKLNYENEPLSKNPKYENEGVQDTSYVEPKGGEPKPVNSTEEESPDDNLHRKSGEKKMCELKKI